MLFKFLFGNNNFIIFYKSTLTSSRQRWITGGILQNKIILLKISVDNIIFKVNNMIVQCSLEKL